MSEREMLLYLLLEENEEEEMVLQQINNERNAETHIIFKTRPEEGYFTVLINRHLLQDDKKFREFFRLNIAQFNYVLDLVKDNLKKDSTNRFPYPITPDQKLAVTLR